MVSMKMRNKDMVNARKVNTQSPKLHLCSFATINQKKPLMYIKHMSGWKF